MKILYMFLLVGAIAALVFNSIEADSKVNTTSSNGLDAADVESLMKNGTSSGKLGQINDENEKTSVLVKGNSSKHVVSVEAEKDDVVNVRSSESKNDKKGDFKNVRDHASEDHDGDKAKSVGGLGLDSGHGVTLSSERMDSSIQGEHCDSSSYSCNIEEESLLACLRVPGNESPDLSLLVQNKGKRHLSVTISASKYVELEKRQIELKEMENKKIKVSFQNSRSDNLVILEAGKGKCELDFRDLIGHNTDNEPGDTSHFKHLSFSSSAMVIFLAALLMCASVWPCINFCKKKNVSKGGGKYQKLDMKLPISDSGKIEADVSDGWDKSWDDNWDDIEAPKSPVTPSLPSKGVPVPRWSNKEGWKD
ncbi:unnamed protein product [Cuscuta campestris]|uniref:DUF7356 domain-containing protein n=1 Tax=Cuscuta campestris TaxID=132261 RepID=A0A484KT92_9ASTE|nr:unnamed protein product [Cuscuta campestris]